MQRKNLASLSAANETSKSRKSQGVYQPSELSRVAAEYALALGNPFDGPLATIPDFPSVPSRRMRCFSRGTFSTGTGGFGFCIADPYAFAANDLNSIFKTDATYASASGLTATAIGAGVQGATSNSDYASAAFGATTRIRGRIVAFGLRIRYLSTELNRGGIVLGVQTPNHTNLTGLTFAQLDAYECAARFRPNQGWFTALYCPAYDFELVYSDSMGSQGGVFSAYTSYPILGFDIMSPSAATTIGFEYECFGLYEFQGQAVRGMVPSMADPAGFAAVQTTAQSTMMRPHTGSSSAHAQKLLTAAHTVAHHTLTGFLGKVVDSGVSWIEKEGASVLAGLSTLL